MTEAPDRREEDSSPSVGRNDATGSSDQSPAARTDGGTAAGEGDPDAIPTGVLGQDVESRDGADGGDGTIPAIPGGPDRNGEDPDGDEDAVEPVELLVQLARDGEIDPWDIDIVHVTDRFLAALEETDLRTTGRALFYASVLLRMKSDELFTRGAPAEPEPAPWDPDGEGPGEPIGPDPVAALEAEMERRLERKHARGTPETLDELVRDLRDAERGRWWKTSREYDTTDSPRGFRRGVQELEYHSDDAGRVEHEPTSGDVTRTTHAEDIEEVIERVAAALDEQYVKGRDEVLFAEIREAGGSPVMTYLALLFLAHRGRIRLQQDRLFGDLWIQQPAVEAEGTEAVAD